MHGNLPVLAAHDSAAAAKDKHELVGHRMLRPDRELGAGFGNVGDHATQWRRSVPNLDLREVVDIMPLTKPVFAQPLLQPKTCHRTSSLTDFTCMRSQSARCKGFYVRTGKNETIPSRADARLRIA